MPIIYSVIADVSSAGSTTTASNSSTNQSSTNILVDHTLEGIKGNFLSVIQGLLPRIDTSTDNRRSYTYDKYLIHYEVARPCIYMCVSDSDFQRSFAFKFLRSVKSAFHDRFNVNKDSDTTKTSPLPVASVAASEYRAFESTLRNLMLSVNDDYESAGSSSPTAHLYNNSTGTSTDGEGVELQSKSQNKRYQPEKGSKLHDVRSNLDAMQPIIVDNIDRLVNRGERLELLVDKADQLQNNSVKFQRGSRGLKQQYFFENVRQWGLMAGCATLFILFCYALFD